VFLPNSREARELTGLEDLASAALTLAGLSAQVAVKDGPHGAVGAVGQTLTRAAGISTRTVDTTGAGDCFTAGYIYGLLAGSSQEDCLRYGNICGGLSTQQLGGTGFHVSQEVLLAHYKKYYK
jgi:sugar/nucleoside kinase (ribokinase family)